MQPTARLLVPALRWDDTRGYDGARDTIELGLGLGVGGFCIFGGTAAAVRDLTTELQQRSSCQLLIAADLERGAGQQFAGATGLPPLGALGHLDDADSTRRAGSLTAREAVALGVNWIFAPVADLDNEPANPIVGTRAFGTSAARVAEHVVAWIEGAQGAGALCCAKHFPGHGRTREDSHVLLPSVSAERAALEQDLQPFRAAVRAGVASVMTAHVAYDALHAGVPATLSRHVVSDLLRGVLGYDGLIVSDSLRMSGLLHATAGDETQAAISALNAGCDVLLDPADLQRVAAAVAAAYGVTLSAESVEHSLGRIQAACQRAGSPEADGWGSADDRVWADAAAAAACVVCRGAPAAAPVLDVLTIDDDVRGTHRPPDRTAFVSTLLECGVDARETAAATAGRALLIALHADVRTGKAGAEPGAAALEALRAALAIVPDATVVLFGHPRLAAVTGGAHILAAWGGEPVMQRAAAHRLTQPR
jgi:beta-glucosidase-like glycosyl hydrolase